MAPSRAVAVLICVTAVCVQCRVIQPADEGGRQFLQPNPDGSFPHNRANYKDVMSQDLIDGVTASGNPDAKPADLFGNNSVLLNPAPGSEKDNVTLSQVNKNAPVYKIPTAKGVQKARPVASQLLHSSSSARPKADEEGKVHAMQSFDDAGGSVLQTPGLFGTAAGLGDELELQVGVRIATPVFGSGFNFCVSRYFSSFPKVGIVIPNPVAWLLPEFLDMANNISTTLQIPSAGSTAPFGAQISPTSDGFLIWLPAIAPRSLSEFGFRWGLQVAQLFGVDFGFGWAGIRCAVDFSRV